MRIVLCLVAGISISSAPGKARAQTETRSAADRDLSLDRPGAMRSAVTRPEDFTETIVPITAVKTSPAEIRGEFGTGFCLDLRCRFIGTNYHVAMTARPRKIKGERVVERYLATGPDDEGAIANDGPSMSAMKFTPSRDLAIFKLRHPLPHYHGIPFSLNELQTGEEVCIYTFPKDRAPLIGLEPLSLIYIYR